MSGSTRFDLVPFSPRPEHRVCFSLEREDCSWTMTWEVRGASRNLVLGSPARPGCPSSRVRGLWERTCFELFFGPAADRWYMELNVSGTGDWNLYRFDGQRSGMREQTMDEAPASRLDVEPTLVRMVCSLRLDHVRLPSAITAGPAVVLEHEDGSRSCWALSHPEARPDFHLREHHALFDYGREGLDAGPAGRYMSIKR